ncbi:MAG: hypothetical protein ACJAVA_000285 [Flavobacteriaceae bacterium]|jgi:hypothetical protein
MNTILRIVSKSEKSGYNEIDNLANFQPRKGDHLVYKGDSYIVSFVEYDFDNATMYIVVIEN